MTAFDSIPDPIRRRLQFGMSPAECQFHDIKLAGFARINEYRALVMRVSAGESIDPDEILDAAARIGRSPARVHADLHLARVAWVAWQQAIDPV